MIEAYSAIELRVIQAADGFCRGDFPSKAAAARHFNAPYDRVKNRIAGRDSRNNRPGAGKLLTEEEEKGLTIWFKRSNKIRQRVNRDMLTYKKEESSQELDRQAAEDPERLAAWYEEFAQVVAQNDILSGDIYNYDETGVRLGIVENPVQFARQSQATAITSLHSLSSKEKLYNSVG
ncbi:hypothetical protein Vi05172_g5413 [Venturia inaequalis]|nr:hypothetical protein Vi05172_g5413 [Venturia inaequalis]